MPVFDLDIARSAHLFIQLHGDEATARARKMVEETCRKGDQEGADTWLRITWQSANLVIRHQMCGTNGGAHDHA